VLFDSIYDTTVFTSDKKTRHLEAITSDDLINLEDALQKDLF